ncbi:hypothetical protein [Moritella viscosa]|uniref:hypothetical protein n=1 Tax=Moritella viscosa TaxID=80854 RepID=UPI0011146F76|nr:hypothetical protein [Moritella viscosa]
MDKPMNIKFQLGNVIVTFIIVFLSIKVITLIGETLWAYSEALFLLVLIAIPLGFKQIMGKVYDLCLWFFNPTNKS